MMAHHACNFEESGRKKFVPLSIHKQLVLATWVAAVFIFFLLMVRKDQLLNLQLRLVNSSLSPSIINWCCWC